MEKISCVPWLCLIGLKICSNCRDFYLCGTIFLPAAGNSSSHKKFLPVKENSFIWRILSFFWGRIFLFVTEENSMCWRKLITKEIRKFPPAVWFLFLWQNIWLCHNNTNWTGVSLKHLSVTFFVRTSYTFSYFWLQVLQDFQVHLENPSSFIDISTAYFRFEFD